MMPEAPTRPADSALIKRASRFPKKLLRRESGTSQHAIDRFFRREKIHPATRKKLAEVMEKLEQRGNERNGDVSPIWRSAANAEFAQTTGKAQDAWKASRLCE